MTDFGRIGLNEVGLGIPVPGYWGELFGRTIGHGPARTLLLSGTMLPSQKALELGLLDDMCEKSLLMPRAEAQMTKMLKIPSEGRAATKIRMFGGFVEQWTNALEEEAEWAFVFLSRPKNVQFLKSIMDGLSNKHSARL